jgi:hypothetical protein
MTTFDDTDLFTDAFHDFRGVDAVRRRSGWLTALVLVAAAALVAVGFVWARGGPFVGGSTVEAASLLPEFAAEQTSADRLSSDDIAGLGVDPHTTRYLTETSTGRHYAAVGVTGNLCVVTTQSGELPVVSCARPTPTARVAVDDTLVVVTASGTAPAAADGWREAGPDVFVND